MDFLSSWTFVQSKVSERSKPAVEKFYNILASSKTAMKKTYFHTNLYHIFYFRPLKGYRITRRQV